MPKMPEAGKYHRNTVFIGGFDGFGVLHGTARLDDRGGAETSGFIDIVTKRKERVGSDGRAFEGKFEAFGTRRRDPHGIHAIHLTGSDAGGIADLKLLGVIVR